MTLRPLLAVCALALVAPGLAAQGERDRGAGPGFGGEVLAPDGPVADLVARLPAVGRAPEGTPYAWPAWDDRSQGGWAAEPAWRRWVELLRAEARASSPDPTRRAELALLARAQGRDGDAWGHLLACRDDPALVRYLLPHFMPGLPLAALGGELPSAGLVLRPALPPVEETKESLRALAGRKLEHRNLKLGETVLSVTVLIEGDGVQVDVVHHSGPPQRLSVLPPVPPGVEVGVSYLDWTRLDVPHGPVEMLVGPGEENERHSVWGRFLTREERWPRPPTELTRRPPLGQHLRVASETGDEPHLARFTEALGELFRMPSELVRQATLARSDDLYEPLLLRLTGPHAERKLVSMISLAERQALAGPH